MAEDEKGKGSDPILLTAEVALRLRRSSAWVREHAAGKRKPKLPGFKIGTDWGFLESDIDQFIRNLREQFLSDAA